MSITAKFWVRTGEILGVLGTFAVCLLWLGALNHRVEATEHAVEVTPSVATDVAVLKSQVGEMKASIEEIKREQRTIDDRAQSRQEEIIKKLDRL